MDILQDLEAHGVNIVPKVSMLRLLKELDTYEPIAGFKRSEFIPIEDIESAVDAGSVFGYPFVIKSRQPSKHHKTTALITSKQLIAQTLSDIGWNQLVAEPYYAKSLYIPVVRRKANDCMYYPIGEQFSMGLISIAPAIVSNAVSNSMRELASSVVDHIFGNQIEGLFIVSAYLQDNNALLFNNISIGYAISAPLHY